MSVLVDETTRVLVQGVTGREARMVTGHMVAYGTPVVAGVTPGRGDGEPVTGVPVFDTVQEAVDATGATATLISVPPGAVLDAALEALAHGLRLLLIATEGVPQLDAMRLLRWADDSAARVIGPNSVGIINPSLRLKLGAIGGENPERAFAPGRIGVVSRSGGMTAEIGLMLRRVGLGVSTAVSVGGDALIGMPPARLLPLYERDEQTDGVVLFGEPGTHFEEEVAEVVRSRRYTKPLIAVVAGRFTESLPEGTAFGHAAAIIEGPSGRPSAKMAALRDVGALVAEEFDDLLQYLSLTFRHAPYYGAPIDPADWG
ncbi:MAG TPA: succinate--CoA ligase subunit alpha [Thermomicrobiaceae bacterium]|nr:succinate--CoA ligase subunit alpha [Thermomicrobiaceae bacterium]